MRDENFIQAILETPEDRALRLVYADWLEEQGDPRGQFLRVTQGMWETPICTARYRKLWMRRKSLRGRIAGEWAKIMLRAPFPYIRQRLEELSRLDTARAVFASDRHGYRLNPPLPLARVEQIESRLGYRLPEQYRRFVTEFADGGAGPDYGIRSLDSLLGEGNNPGWIESLTRPFPVPDTVEEMRSIEDPVPGALPICEIGCGSCYYLILAGPETGHIWIQNTNGDWSPALFDESRFPSGPDVTIDAILLAANRSPLGSKLEFVDWYLKWLDKALWEVTCKSTAVEELFDLDPDTTELSVMSRELSALPDRLRGLTALRSLNLHGNHLTELPDWIGELTDLAFLSTGGNRLSQLPETLGNLSRLSRLNCGHMETLRQLPESIGRLLALEDLRLGFNKLEALPDSIGALSRLRNLDLSHNELKDLPTTIGGLHELRELKLTWNKLSRLPAGLANLTHLSVLDLRANDFRRLPESVCELPVLQTLHLGENPSLDIADACRKLVNVPTLRSLSLFMNKLTELPSEIGLLTQLTSLDLSWNALSGLPVSLSRLTNLVKFNLVHNPDHANLRNRLRELLPGYDSQER